MMKYTRIIIIALLITSCNTQTQKKYNLDFEQSDKDNKKSIGWFRWSDYEISMDKSSHSGKYSGKIISNKGGKSGRIAYVIPADYDGKNIVLEGFMKTKNVRNGFAGLFMKIEGTAMEHSGINMGFDDMSDQNIHGTSDWKKYSISLKFPKDADLIYVGGLLQGEGEVWFDDFVLTIDGKNIQFLEENEKKIPKATLDKEFAMGSNIKIPKLNNQLTINLELLGKIWGFLKYHHPEIAEGNYNWDYELLRFLPKYLNINNVRDRDKMLAEWIDGLGELQKCNSCNSPQSDAFLKPDLSWIKNGKMDSKLKEKLNNIYLNRHQGKQYYIELNPNIGNPEFLNENASYIDAAYPDVGFRLVSLYRYWNIIQYFFPYKYLTDKNWDDVLKEYIPKFIYAKNELQYQLAVLKLSGEIDDTHASISMKYNKINKKRGNYYPPFEVRFVENELVVTNYYNPGLKKTVGLSKGDIISKINGQSVNTIVDSLKEYYPASNDVARMRNISADILRSNRKNTTIEYISDKKVNLRNVPLYAKESLNIVEYYKNNGGVSFKSLDGNIGYINLRSLRHEEIDKVKKLFKNTKGIIIDIRNYPNTFVPFYLGSYFVSKTVPFVKFTKGNVDNPGEFTFTKPVEIPKSSESYNGKLIVLVNELSQSQSEYTAMAFRAGKNTTIVGSTTAGADGNVSTVMLPGGLRTSFSGKGVYYPDGSETQRIGIVPDVVLKPTINGIKNGKDELLEKAIEIILNE